jgi:hypothetical protein
MSIFIRLAEAANGVGGVRWGYVSWGYSARRACFAGLRSILRSAPLAVSPQLLSFGVARLT